MTPNEDHIATMARLLNPAPKIRQDFGDGRFQGDEYYDAQGRQTSDASKARSKVEFRPHDFRHFVKVDYVTWFGFGSPAVRWDFHHRSDTFGSWMWPDGMPLRFDGVDNFDVAIDHAAKLGSTWRPGVDT